MIGGHLPKTRPQGARDKAKRQRRKVEGGVTIGGWPYYKEAKGIRALII